jgi:hypothetical protein
MVGAGIRQGLTRLALVVVPGPVLALFFDRLRVR